MQRIISMITIAALLSVTSIPLLPKAAVCHAVEANADCGTCHTDADAAKGMVAHAMHAPGDSMEHEMQGDEHRHGMHDHNMHQQTPPAHQHDQQMQKPDKLEKPLQMHKHQKQLSAAEKNCRIECGCGCNHSVDGLPYLLAPHVAATVQFESGEQSVRIEPVTYPVLFSINLNNPPPPPRTI